MSSAKKILGTPFRAFSYCAGIVLLLVITGSANAEDPSQNAEAVKKTAPYYRDAQICRARSQIRPLPEGSDPATQLDVDAYLACLGQMGYRQDKKTDPLVAALRRCYALKTKAVTASGETLYRTPSQAQMRVCLSSRGFPSSGRAPDPNAAANIGSLNPNSDSASAEQTLKDSRSRPWEHSDDDRVETVIIPPRNSTGNE